MPLFAQKTLEKVNISGHWLDNSKLNKLGNIRISPLKSFAILFFVLALILPQAVSKISDLNLYFTKFSAAKELAQAAGISAEEKNNFLKKSDQEKPEQEKKEELKFKKLTLADIWPGEFSVGKSSSKIILAANSGFTEIKKVQTGEVSFADIWPEEIEREAEVPRRLIIPAIKATANIQSLGIGQGGEMEAPNNFQEVGWFNLGPRPGEHGVAVIAGHLNNEYGAAGIFWHLSKLKEGDDIYVADASGKTFRFKVSGNKIYSADSLLEEIFERGGGARLNLITCNGAWDKNAQNYTKRLVVYAELLVE